MVEVEISTPVFNEELHALESRAVALVRADGEVITVYGSDEFVPMDPVMDVLTGQSVHPAEDAEAWARNLPYAYNAGDLVAAVLRDDNPSPAAADGEPERPEPLIPDPPSPVYNVEEVASAC